MFQALIDIETPKWFLPIFRVVFPTFVLLIIIYTYYWFFKLLTSKCVNCRRRPKLSGGKWIWELWKVGAMPWKKVRVFCERCQKKVVYHKGKFINSSISE